MNFTSSINAGIIRQHKPNWRIPNVNMNMGVSLLLSVYKSIKICLMPYYPIILLKINFAASVMSVSSPMSCNALLMDSRNPP